MRKFTFILLVLIAVYQTSCSDKDETWINLTELQLKVEAKANHPDLHTDLFPSFLYLAQGLHDYYKEQGHEVFTDQVLELSFINPAEGTRLKLDMRESDLTEAVSWQYTAGTEPSIKTMLPVQWKYEQLKEWKENAQLTFVWDVTIDNRKAGTLHQSFTCHDIHEFPERIFVENARFVGTLKTDSEGAVYPAAIFPAYISENNPLVNDLLQQAVSDGAIESFDGYDSDNGQIAEQLAAMWYVMLANNITYGNHYFIPGYWSERHIRKIRSIDDVMASSTGNCIELPMIIMAMCHHAGLKVVSFHVDNSPQDHMYMGVLDNQGHLAYILNPAYMVRMNWGDKTREEQISMAKKQLKALLEVSKDAYEIDKEYIISGTPHYEMIDFEEVRKFIPSIN